MRTQWGGYEQMNWDQRMVYDTVRPHFFSTHQEPEAEGASSSFPAVQEVDQPLYSGYDQSQLAAVARLVNIKVEHNMSERCYDQVSQCASDLLPRDHTLPSNYYNTKKMIRDLGLPVEKIHACRNRCMLYWKDDIDMEYCKFFGDPRYKPTRGRNPRPTAEHMTWHEDATGGYEQMNKDQRMVYDTVRPQFFSTHQEPEAEGASSSFPAVDQPLYSGCDQSQLGAVARLVNIKVEHNMSERRYDQVSQCASDLLTRDHTLPSNYYNTKKMIGIWVYRSKRFMRVGMVAMLYWKDDIDMEYCKFCGEPRYKPTRDQNPRHKKSPYVVLRYLPLTPRLQRLYASPATAEHKTWHASHVTEEDSMCHPSDAEA
ncbi:UNVERIFIED_CONTAM: hypothetical protein Sangu_2475300 [Sesamum angustifolium]|uniref:Uncharacterized protein n=1 Tax=Sesamum angustifolium TaxID=2727405 RepID=A0AAW2IPS2_9LAMI